MPSHSPSIVHGKRADTLQLTVSHAWSHAAMQSQLGCTCSHALPLAALPVPQIKEQEEVLRQQLADMRAKEAEQGSDIPGLILVREECR